ncbi:MAG: NgoFVII family restriction endonuclease, partial [Pirellula sp.]
MPTIQDALEYFDTTLDELLKRGLWSRLLADSGIDNPVEAPDEDRLAKGVRRASHINCPRQIRGLLDYITTPDKFASHREPTIVEMLHTALWGTTVGEWSLDQVKRRLLDNPSVMRDLQSVLEYRLNHSLQSKIPVSPQLDPLSIHASYTRDEILVALGHWGFERRPSQREGVL